MDNNDKQDKIAAIIILIIILLLGGLLADFLTKNFAIITVDKNRPHIKRENKTFEKIKNIVSMPLYYITAYPQMIMCLSEGGCDSPAPTTRSKPQKQFIKY